MTKFVPYLFLVFSLVACKKENDSLNNNSNNNAAVDTTQLVVYYERNPAMPTVSDSVMKVEYFYDDNNRISETRSYSFYYSSPTLVLGGTSAFRYLGNDTLPYLRIHYPSPSNSLQYRDSVFLFYNTAGQLSLDSAREYIATDWNYAYVRTNEYYYSGNAVSVYRINYYSGGSVIMNHANWTYNTDLNLQTLHNSDGFTSRSDYQFTFDDHPNPFKIKGYRDYSVFGDNYGTSFSISSSSKNNLTSIVQDYHDATTDHHSSGTRSFTYKQNGYPDKVDYYDNSNGTAVYQKTGYYVYKH